MGISGDFSSIPIREKKSNSFIPYDDFIKRFAYIFMIFIWVLCLFRCTCLSIVVLKEVSRQHKYIQGYFCFILFYFICFDVFSSSLLHNDFLCHQQSHELHRKNGAFIHDCNSPSAAFDEKKTVWFNRMTIHME